jgi:hypothetical protein
MDWKPVDDDVSEEEMLTFVAQFAEGECLCSEIDPSDRPCLTCDGQAAVRKLRGEPEPGTLTLVRT